MFRSTFEQIRDNFRPCSPKYSAEAKADLVLMDENDLLESGIEIVARPPGKTTPDHYLCFPAESKPWTAVSLLFQFTRSSRVFLRVG